MNVTDKYIKGGEFVNKMFLSKLLFHGAFRPINAELGQKTYTNKYWGRRWYGRWKGNVTI